jgi:hypothetical protein
MLTVVLLAAMEKALLLMLVALGAAAAVGLYEAWSRKRGLLGWILSVAVALVGGFAGAIVTSTVLESAIMVVGEKGAPLLQLLGLPVMAGMVLLGSWGALRVASRYR